MSSPFEFQKRLVDWRGDPGGSGLSASSRAFLPKFCSSFSKTAQDIPKSAGNIPNVVCCFCAFCIYSFLFSYMRPYIKDILIPLRPGAAVFFPVFSKNQSFFRQNDGNRLETGLKTQKFEQNPICLFSNGKSCAIL